MSSKISWKRYYRLDTKINEVEDRTHEFKNHWFITQAQIKRGGFRLHPITTVICGFLNQGLGYGFYRIFFGTFLLYNFKTLFFLIYSLDTDLNVKYLEQIIVEIKIKLEI